MLFLPFIFSPAVRVSVQYFIDIILNLLRNGYLYCLYGITGRSCCAVDLFLPCAGYQLKRRLVKAFLPPFSFIGGNLVCGAAPSRPAYVFPCFFIVNVNHTVFHIISSLHLSICGNSLFCCYRFRSRSGFFQEMISLFARDRAAER